MNSDAKNIEYNFDLNGYKHFLIEDLKKNRDIAELAHALSFTDAPSMEDWVKGIEGKDLYTYRQTLPFKGIIPTEIMTSVKSINYKNRYFLEDKENLYQFFARKTYDSYEDLARDNRYYFVYNTNFFKNIDKLLFAKLMANDGYRKISKGICLQLKEKCFH